MLNEKIWAIACRFKNTDKLCINVHKLESVFREKIRLV